MLASALISIVWLKFPLCVVLSRTTSYHRKCVCHLSQMPAYFCVKPHPINKWWWWMYVNRVCVYLCSYIRQNFSVNHKKCKHEEGKVYFWIIERRENNVHSFHLQASHANRILPVVFIHKTTIHFIAFTCYISCHFACRSHKISINILPSGGLRISDAQAQLCKKKTHKTFIVYCTRQNFHHLGKFALASAEQISSSERCTGTQLTLRSLSKSIFRFTSLNCCNLLASSY